MPNKSNNITKNLSGPNPFKIKINHNLNYNTYIYKLIICLDISIDQIYSTSIKIKANKKEMNHYGPTDEQTQTLIE